MLALVAIGLTYGLQFTGIPAPFHIPVGGWECRAQWAGFPFGYVSDDQHCLAAIEELLNYFVNGFLNVLIFFLPLRLIHDRFMHRKGTVNRKQ